MKRINMKQVQSIRRPFEEEEEEEAMLVV